jgi:hypothetical protein
MDLCSIGGFPLKEFREHCFQIQSVTFVVIHISFQCYCGECSGYIVVILPLLEFYFYSAYILDLVYYKAILLYYQIAGAPQDDTVGCIIPRSNNSCQFHFQLL